MSEKARVLRSQEEEGKTILRMRPIDRQAYTAWSDLTREVVGDVLGAGSPLHREIIAARRTISVRYDTDPSYYLTQLAANLRRELEALRKCVEAAIARPPAPAAPPEAASPSSPPRREPKHARPAKSHVPIPLPEAVSREAAALPAPPGGSRFLVVPGMEEKTARSVLSALERSGAEVFRVAGNLGDLRHSLSPPGADTCAVVLLPGASVEEAAFALGFLTGVLGSDRVAILLGEGADVPAHARGVEAISLADPDGWRPKVLAALGRHPVTR